MTGRAGAPRAGVVTLRWTCHSRRVTHSTLGPVDAIWLHTGRPANLMVIEALVLLEGTLDRERFAALVQRRLVERFPVFAQRPVGARLPGMLPRWRDVEDFDLADHLHEVTLPAPATDADLQHWVAGHLSTPLRGDRPLWEVHLVEGRPEGTALFVRLHHALADGIALTRVLLSITDVEAEDDLGADSAEQGALFTVDTSRPRRRPSASTAWGERISAAARWSVRSLPVLGKVLFSRTPRTALSGRSGPDKLVSWARPMDLEQVKDVARASGTTVNDVLVSALAGALSRYQAHHGGAAVDVTTMIPVNLRPLDQPLPARLGNRFAVVLLRLPSAAGSAVDRLEETKRRMDRIKASPEPLVTFALLHAIGLCGRRLGAGVVWFFSTKAIGVTTNVPGPREPRFIAGTRVGSLMGWVPGSGHQSIGTCVLTYAGRVHVGFKVDAATIPDPEVILEGFHAEIDALLALSPAASRPGPVFVPAP